MIHEENSKENAETKDHFCPFYRQIAFMFLTLQHGNPAPSLLEVQGVIHFGGGDSLIPNIFCFSPLS